MSRFFFRLVNKYKHLQTKMLNNQLVEFRQLLYRSFFSIQDVLTFVLMNICRPTNQRCRNETLNQKEFQKIDQPVFKTRKFVRYGQPQRRYVERLCQDKKRAAFLRPKGLILVTQKGFYVKVPPLTQASDEMESHYVLCGGK